MAASFSGIEMATPADRPRLFEVWEASVRATHTFLSETDLQEMSPQVRWTLDQYPRVYCLRGEDGQVVAFMGVEKGEIEMLFIHPAARGMGAGRTLVEYAIQVHRARRVDVNEQNTQAVGFYEHLGFRQASRSPLDAFGKPFPILHMKLAPRTRA